MFKLPFQNRNQSSLDSSQSSISVSSCTSSVASPEIHDDLEEIDYVIVDYLSTLDYYGDKDHDQLSDDSLHSITPEPICPSLPCIAETSSRGNLTKASRSAPVMSRGQWNLAIQLAMGSLQQRSSISSRITLSHFTIEIKNRYIVQKSALPLFKIFPQFHAGGDDLRFRQTLSGCPGPTIEEVIEAANFFLERMGRFSDSEIRFLTSYYDNMEVPVLSTCLTAILAVSRAFQKEFRRHSAAESIPQIIARHTEELRELAQRVTTLEEEGPRLGGDRACFYPIRPCDFKTRGEWCVPGGVFGLYSDGVGKLLPIKDAAYRRSVVVYSTNPDTVEPHPDPANPESYARVVMLGEAPIKLRPDQYEKLLRHRRLFDIYVNHMGDVCIRMFEKRPPSGGTVIGMTSWEEGYPTDTEGYPVFQDTRGVRAHIFGPSQNPNPRSLVGTVDDLARQAVWKVRGSPMNVPPAELMEERLKLFEELAEMKTRFSDRLQNGQGQWNLVEREEMEEKISELIVRIKNLTKEIKAML